MDEKTILEALSKVEDPELKRDLVSLGMIRNLKIEKGKVSFDIALTTSKCPLKHQMADQARAVVLAIPGVKSVEIGFGTMAKDEPQSNKTEEEKKKVLDMRDESRLIGVKNIIAVASGKGGVGKSTIAVNIAAALAADGHMVGLLDADIYGPSVPMMLNIDETPQTSNNKLCPVEKYTMKVISMGMFVTAGEALIWRGPMVMKALQQFLDDVDWGELDYLIIDLPPGTGDAQLSIAQLVKTTGAVIVTTPQDLAFLDVTRAVAMFERVDVPIIGIVENMSYFKCPHCGEETEIFQKGSNYLQAGQLGYPLLATLPIDPALTVAGDQGKPIVLSQPTSESGTRLINLARKIHAEINKEKE